MSSSLLNDKNRMVFSFFGTTHHEDLSINFPLEKTYQSLSKHDMSEISSSVGIMRYVIAPPYKCEIKAHLYVISTDKNLNRHFFYCSCLKVTFFIFFISIYQLYDFSYVVRGQILYRNM